MTQCRTSRGEARTRRWLFVLLLLVGAFAQACHGKGGDSGNDNTGAVPTSNQLPPLKLKDDTPHLLLTWIDKKGDFHVVQKTGDVPAQGRSAVRVVETNREDGTGQLVYVANLKKKRGDGTYPVKTMTRAQWDEKGASRRKERLEALAPSASTPPPSSAAPSPGSAAPGQHGVVAILYGASWCKPCHDAQRYLEQRGVKVIHKDIESDAVARREMQRKLAANHLRTGEIPIIDIGGHILVGFSANAIDQALAAAQNTQTL
jgi:glutaredoxin